MAKQLLGKEVTAALNEKIKANVAELEAKGVKPTLGIIRVGEREDDLSYERGATKRCETLGVAYEKFLLPADVTQEELMATRSEEHTSELQSLRQIVCRLLLEKKKKKIKDKTSGG